MNVNNQLNHRCAAVCARAYARTRGNQRDEADPGASTLRQSFAQRFQFPIGRSNYVHMAHTLYGHALPTPNCRLSALPHELDRSTCIRNGRVATGRLPRGENREKAVSRGEKLVRTDLSLCTDIFYSKRMRLSFPCPPCFWSTLRYTLQEE